jgi:hypothetical protein
VRGNLARTVRRGATRKRVQPGHLAAWPTLQTTGMNVQVVCTLEGQLEWISDPLDGCRHDTHCLCESGALPDDAAHNWVGDKGYVGNDMATPHKKPIYRDLVDWEKEYNTAINCELAAVDELGGPLGTGEPVVNIEPGPVLRWMSVFTMVSCVVEAGQLRISAGSGMTRSATSRRGVAGHRVPRPMRSTASGGRVPLISRRRSSRAVAISTIWDRKDTDSPSTAAVSRTRLQGLSGADAGRRPRQVRAQHGDHRLVFEIPPGTRAAPEPAVSSRSIHWSCGAGWGPADGRGHPVPPMGWCLSSGRARRRSPGSASCSRCARAASRCSVQRCIGSSITCSQEPSSRATCRSARCSAGPTATSSKGRRLVWRVGITKATGMAAACTGVLRWHGEPGHCAERAMNAR